MLLKALLIGITVASFLYSHDSTTLFKFLHPVTEQVDRFLFITLLTLIASIVYYLVPVTIGVFIAAVIAFALLFLVAFTQWVRQ